MFRGLSLFTIVLVSLNLCVANAETWSHKNRRDRDRGQDQGQGQWLPPTGQLENDREIISALQNRRRVNFVKGMNLVVVKLLPDDRQGLPHQKFVVKVSSGAEVLIVSNLDLCQHIDLKIGQQVGVAGEFIWTNTGGLIHWTHRDPQHRRPDGYITANGQTYCK